MILPSPGDSSVPVGLQRRLIVAVMVAANRRAIRPTAPALHGAYKVAVPLTRGIVDGARRLTFPSVQD